MPRPWLRLINPPTHRSAPPNRVAFCRTVEVIGTFAPPTDGLDRGPTPALVFEFTHLDGSRLPVPVLVLDEDRMREFVFAVQDEVDRAIVKAHAVREAR